METQPELYLLLLSKKRKALKSQGSGVWYLISSPAKLLLPEICMIKMFIFLDSHFGAQLSSVSTVRTVLQI